MYGVPELPFFCNLQPEIKEQTQGITEKILDIPYLLGAATTIL